MGKIQLIPLVVSLLICFTAAAVGSYFTTPAINGWYATLNKPFFNPPNWIFAPVWTTLYFAMGISLYLVWIKKAKTINKQRAIAYFMLQLVLNVVWSLMFFGLQSPIMALITIIALWIFIYLTMQYFFQISKRGGLLLVPYLAWVSFAAILNLSIVLLNR